MITDACAKPIDVLTLLVQYTVHIREEDASSCCYMIMLMSIVLLISERSRFTALTRQQGAYKSVIPGSTPPQPQKSDAMFSASLETAWQGQAQEEEAQQYITNSDLSLRADTIHTTPKEALHSR